LISLKECVGAGLLRQTAPSKEQALLSLDKAERALEDAKANLKDGRYDATIILGYAALLSASKAILFRDGMREKSHACVVRYLEAKHSDKLNGRDIRLLDSFREARHEVQYSPAFKASELQAREIVKFAGDFINKAGGIIGV